MVNRVCRFSLLVAAALAIIGCGGNSSSGNPSAGSGSNQTPAATASFSFSAPAEIAVTPNSLQTVSISVVPANGFSSAVSVTLSGLPAGVTATPSTFTLASRATAQTVAIQANAGVTPGPINLVVTGTSGSLTQSMTTSTSQADFALSGPSQPIALTVGATAQVSVSAASFNGFSGQVAAAVTGLPAGVTASPSTLTFAPGAAESVTLTAAASAQPGSSTLVLAGTSGALTNNLELPLALAAAPTAPPVVPDFALSLSPSAITLSAGGSPGQVSISATAINGFTGPIDV